MSAGWLVRCLQCDYRDSPATYILALAKAEQHETEHAGHRCAAYQAPRDRADGEEWLRRQERALEEDQA